MIPGVHGGTYIVYNKVLRPFVLKHQNKIDESLNKAKQEIGKGTFLRI